MNKKCSFVNKYLIDYVYDEISDENIISEIKSHLSECKSCAEKAADYKRINKIASSTNVDFSEDVWEKHLNQIKEKLKEKQPGFLDAIFENIVSALNVKKLSLALLTVLVVIGSAAIYKNNMTVKMDRVIVEKMDVFENYNIIERLDFYETLSKEVKIL